MHHLNQPSNPPAPFFTEPPNEHISKLAEKYLGLPFWDGPTSRMSEVELRRGIDWVADHFHLIRFDNEAQTIDRFLEVAKAAVLRHGIRGLVLDPYNEFEHKRPSNIRPRQSAISSKWSSQRSRYFDANPTSVRHAFLACVATFHGVRDYLAHPKKPRLLRQRFREKSPAFALIDHVAHAFKHVTAGSRVAPELTAEEVIPGHPANGTKRSSIYRARTTRLAE